VLLVDRRRVLLFLFPCQVGYFQYFRYSPRTPHPLAVPANK